MHLLPTLLDATTVVVGLLGLGVGVWSGLAFVALAPMRINSWAAALIFWSISLFFLLNLLQMGSARVPGAPWSPYDVFRWVLVPMPLAWLWSFINRLPPRVAALARRTRLFVMAVVILLLLVTVLSWGTFSGPADLRWRWVFYPAYLSAVLATFIPMFLLLRRAEQSTRDPTRSTAHRLLAVATVLASVTAWYGLGGYWVTSTIPILPGFALLLLTLITFGGALVLYRISDGEMSIPAFVYMVANATAITLLYTFVAGVIVVLLDLSWLVLVAVVPFAVSTHWLIGWLQSLFDHAFYRAPIQQLRLELQALLNSVEQEQPLESHLRRMLMQITSQVDASAAVIALFDRSGDATAIRVMSAYPAGDIPPLDPSTLLIDAPASVNVPSPPDVPAGAAWGVPLMSATKQIGTLVAWSDPRRSFNDVDITLLKEATNQLAPLVVSWEVQSRRLAEIEHIAATYRAQAESLQAQMQTLHADLEDKPDLEEVSNEARTWVEEALRNLHNVSYLGQHPLASLSLVDARIPSADSDVVTHIERGQAVREICEELIERLRPAGPEPGEPYPAEWRLYTVLHAAYVEDEPNREIMSRLYISQPTFHRARRQALSSLADALVELETAARLRTDMQPGVAGGDG